MHTHAHTHLNLTHIHMQMYAHTCTHTHLNLTHIHTCTHTHLNLTHIHTCTHTACMREQLAQALAMQQVLTVERDQAREQCQLVQEREAELIKQLERLRRTHSESMHHIG